MSTRVIDAPSTDHDEQVAFAHALIAAGLWLPSGVPGVYGTTGAFDDVVERLLQRIDAIGRDDGAERVRFPPLVTRPTFERTEYMESFPQLAGAVFSFTGDDRAHQELIEDVRRGGAWGRHLAPTDVVLTPAACYPLYPTAKGILPPAGRLVDLASWCFRHEPSPDPARLQMFRMRELVRMGEPARIAPWRDQWVERGLALMQSLGLPAYVAPANDPFFGRGGRMMAVNQREQRLKFEIVVPICSTAKPTAIMSFNYHQDHFARLFDIRSSDGGLAHTACLGFGIERIVLALFKHHGLDPRAWPASPRQALWS